MLCRRSLVGGMQSNTEEEKDFSVQRTVTVDHPDPMWLAETYMHQMGLAGGAWGGTTTCRRGFVEVRQKEERTHTGKKIDELLGKNSIVTKH